MKYSFKEAFAKRKLLNKMEIRVSSEKTNCTDVYKENFFQWVTEGLES